MHRENETKRLTLKKLNDMEKIILFTEENSNESRRSYLFNEWFIFNGMKFRYHIEISNYSNPYERQSISIMKSDGTWQFVGFSNEIGCQEENDYKSPEKWLDIRKRLVNGFDNWLFKVYGS